MQDPLDLPATPVRLRAALDAVGASDEAARRAFGAAAASPRPAEWVRFGSSALLLLGAALILAGVISFFAFNWADLGRFGKFAVLQAAIAACAIAGWRLLDSWAGKVALFAAAVLVGPLLAVYGQAYQTGADPWGLFAAWAALIAPWVVASRFTALWVLAVVLLDVAVVLFCVQVAELGDHTWPAIPVAIAAIHAAAVAAWEWQYRRRVPWLDEVWGPRLLASSGFVALIVPSAWLILGFGDGARFSALALLSIVAATGGALAYYRLVRRDLFMLTAAAGSLLTLLSIVIGRALFKDLDLEIVGLFVMAIVVIGEVALVVTWLRQTSKDWATP